MNHHFKTPAIYNLLAHLKQHFSYKTSIIDTYSHNFSDIDLSKQNHNQTIQETFQQELNLITGETVYIVWNIDSIIQHAKSSHQIPILTPVCELVQCTHLNNSSWTAALPNVSKHSNQKFNHKTDYIIFAELLYFPGLTLIDGNHRFCEALLSKQKNIKCLFLNPSYAHVFLQPDSNRFVSLFNNLMSLLI